MLNPFPIQWLALFAYAILRICVGIVLLYLGFIHHRHKHELATVFKLSWWPFGMFSAITLAVGETILGLLFITGAFTQIAALLTLVMSFKMLIMRNWFLHPTIPPKIFYILLLAVSLSLFITGAGVLAFDLPI